MHDPKEAAEKEAEKVLWELAMSETKKRAAKCQVLSKIAKQVSGHFREEKMRAAVEGKKEGKWFKPSFVFTIMSDKEKKKLFNWFEIDENLPDGMLLIDGVFNITQSNVHVKGWRVK